MYEALVAKLREHVQLANFFGLEKAQSTTLIEEAAEAIEKLNAADVVSRGAFDQTDWERCVALTQLKEIGKSLGERMDDVRPVVFCKDCRHRDPADHKCDCGQLERAGCIFPVDDDYWCAHGER